MGGGDLNLKKSWHPSTLRNIERVWKAEQKHEVEKQKIEQLQKELAEERAREEIQAFAEDQGVVRKRDERLDWMYQGPAAMVNRDEYLLGRKIDKTFEIMEQEGEPKKGGNDFAISSTMFSSQDLSGTATVDLANKIREDPLFSIMKKEKELKKNVLCNPVKIKQLQKLLQQSVSEDKKEKKKKKKKHSERDSEEKDYKRDQHHKKILHPKEKHIHKKISKGRKFQHHEEGDSKSSSSRYEERSHSSRVGQKSDSRHFAEMHGDDGHRGRRKDPHSDRRKLGDEERDRRLSEMQENARWREEQRRRNVQRSREEDEKEERAHRVDAAAFIKPMLSKAAGQGSLENRVKQKIFSIQRNSVEMDKHFARR